VATEDRADVYANAAGLLSRMGYAAACDPEWVPPRAPSTRPVPALVTDAPGIVVGYSVAMVAVDPEAHLPATSTKVRRAAPGMAGDPQYAWWL